RDAADAAPRGPLSTPRARHHRWRALGVLCRRGDGYRAPRRVRSPAAQGPGGRVLRAGGQAHHIGAAAEGVGRAGHRLDRETEAVVLRLGTATGVDLQPGELLPGGELDP